MQIMKISKNLLKIVKNKKYSPEKNTTIVLNELKITD